MNRMSSLPTAKYCGLAPVLGAKYGAGRAAAVSSAFHAQCAGDPSLLLRLTDEERADLADWKRPTDVVLEDGIVLAYADAEKELEVMLPHPTDFLAEPMVGHLDFAWVRQLPKPSVKTMIAYVADIKKSRWTTVDGPESLQLHAYGTAYAELRGCLGYCTGIFIPETAEWMWSKGITWLGSMEHNEILAELIAAGTHTADKGSTGAHCSNCYSRLHCPEWTLPAVLSTTALAPVAEGIVPTPEQAAEMVRWIAALDGEKGLLAKAKGHLKEWVRRGHLTVIDGNKQWVPVTTAGRESVDREKLEAELGGDAKRFIRKGPDFLTYRWIKR